MKTVKLIRFITASVTLMAFSAVLYTSCTKPEENDPVIDTACQNVNCNNGECYQGECGCYAGWDGVFCDIRVVDKFIGKWTAIEQVTFSNDTSNIGDTAAYDFYISYNGNSVTTFKLSGLNDLPNDTIVCNLADPISHQYSRFGFYFMDYPSTTTPDLFLTRGGGRVTSSASFMDTMGYCRWYGMPGNTSFVVKDTVKIVAQKAP